MIQDLEVRHDYVELPSARHSSVQDSEGSGGASVSEDPAGAALVSVQTIQQLRLAGVLSPNLHRRPKTLPGRGHRILMMDRARAQGGCSVKRS